MEMTVEQAFSNISTVCAEFKGNLNDHKVLQESLKTIKEALEKESSKEDK